VTAERVLHWRRLPRPIAPHATQRGAIVEAQQTDDPIPPDRPNHLYAPLPGEPGAHGRFDDQATGRSPTWWVTKQRVRLAPAVLAAAAAGTVAVTRRRG
jgi:hypothetical protein